MGYQGHPHSHPWKLSVLQYVIKKALEKSLSSGSEMERLLWIICVGIVKLKGKFLKVEEGGRTEGQRDEMQERPTHPHFWLWNGAGKGTWAIRKIISISLWRHRKDMYLMVTMHHFFKTLKFTNVLSSIFPSSFSPSVSIDAEMTNRADPHYSKILYL